MGWRRFLTFIVVGITLSWAIACTQGQLNAPAPDDAPAAVVEPVEADPEPAARPLSPEGLALVNSAGPEGLYNPPRGDVRLVAISDLNGPYGSITYDPEIEKAMLLLPFWNPDLVVCSGDMVAGQDLTLTEETMRAMWNGFDQYVGAKLRAMDMPYGFTVGNHDASSALSLNKTFLFQKERDITAEYWLQPEHDPGVNFLDRTDFPFYYTFEQQDIFFLAWDASSDFIPEEKLAWAEAALASEAAQSAKMRVLLGHLPLYSVAIGRDQPGDVMADSDRLRELLERYNVHTYISGHHHAYYPAHKGNLQLLHMGILGSGPRPLLDSALPPQKAITVIDVNFDDPDLTTYTTYDMQTLQVIEMNQLPRFLLGHNGLLLRRDVELSDLDSGEMAQCQQRLGAEKCTA
ncbi:MAG: metallophosphoesterase [Leptolyngbyaceae cyanobacterium T60_A2020_046]|nr:metallophosphoesterase [Leptolyngbyaceae cyanobacterium T60_A2020_046]